MAAGGHGCWLFHEHRICCNPETSSILLLGNSLNYCILNCRAFLKQLQQQPQLARQIQDYTKQGLATLNIRNGMLSTFLHEQMY
jgi:hypothetical protein